MKIAVIKVVPDTVVDGPRMRTSVYLWGCDHHCKGCHNPESWGYDTSLQNYEVDDLAKEMVSYGHKFFTISGGDPFCYQASCAAELCREIRKLVPDADIWAYTGYRYEDLLNGTDGQMDLLREVDCLVDGPFVESLKSKDVRFRGSSNQRIMRRVRDVDFEDVSLKFSK